MRIYQSTISILTAFTIATVTVLPGYALPLSPGDRVRVLTPMDDELPSDSRFRLSGLYEVNVDGTLQIPFLEPQPAVGLEVSDVQKKLAEALVNKGFFRPESLELSVNVVSWAPVQVTVAGETFRPGRVLINAITEKRQMQEGQTPLATDVVTGSYSPDRYLSAAIRGAGGLKPTADLQRIRLLRGKQEKTFDLSGVLTGKAVPDVPLIAGDQVIVPTLTYSQNELVRPSQLTPTDITVFLSNQTAPNTPNASKGGQVVTFAYGTRFSQAVIAAGCAGGTQRTNARRRAVLVQTDRLTGKTTVVERPIERLLKQSDNDAENPFLMPQDGVVCYDSTVTNLASIFRLITDIASPFFLIHRLFRDE
ncbi:polysaccharide biosynthesis/export family protein [Stenomitos frigidus]|uniref:Periplasmic polysaccharide export protein n=1 Tax=Stenomitos frigidus ULC18 TaxID=2107698 RepID=A0A2T1E9S4_9CYAN|nr:polysaccharide biosynthesis/export family protein [Stenomitos frigidus]PSB29453.1 periplasmic polysaccharide export protein [Stenomitos frigidus ULC18]